MSAIELHFIHKSIIPNIVPKAFKPNHFPPNEDWIMSFDTNGFPLSTYKHGIWDFRAYETSALFNFKKCELSRENLSTLKQSTFLILYHPHLFPGKIASCRAYFGCLKKIAEECERNSILMEDLPRFPKVQEAVAKRFPKGSFSIYINFLHKFSRICSSFNLNFVNEFVISNFIAVRKESEKIQTPYIPPRIWGYQVNRLNECLDDFFNNYSSLVTAFNWLSETYEHNVTVVGKLYGSPFHHSDKFRKFRITYPSKFKGFCEEYGLSELFEKWLGGKQDDIRQFSRYFNLVRDAALLYILNFSLQRVGEVVTLRSDCLLIESDPKLGEIFLVVGETTKTDPDSDARWVVPKSVQKAVDAATCIAKLRMRHAPNRFTVKADKVTSVPLALAATEPWSSKHPNLKNQFGETVITLRYGDFLFSYPKALDKKIITISEDDWKTALSLTPNLGNNPKFRIGLPWRLAAHQLRRTTNVNMFASSMVSDRSLQWAMKHLSVNMTMYYGRNHTNLRLNSDAETGFIIEGYKAIYKRLNDVVNDNITFALPHKKLITSSHVIDLIQGNEERKLTQLMKQGLVDCRSTLLGYCMKPGPCSYGGVESLTKCTHGEGGGICMDAVFDRNNQHALDGLKKSFEEKLSSIDPDSPRATALKKEIVALGVYQDVCNRN